MNTWQAQHPKQVAALSLADGSGWRITAGDARASSVVRRLAEVMQLGSLDGCARRLFVLVGDHTREPATVLNLAKQRIDMPVDAFPGVPDFTLLRRGVACSSAGGRAAICVLAPAHNDDLRALQLRDLSLVISLDAESRGGLLLHGALVEKKGCGVILAGPGGVGKTTATQRLPSPWRTLSDDTTLVVRDEGGAYYAHPWPSWGRFMFGGTGGTWDVGHAAPLRAIFFLNQAPEERLEALGAGRATCLLVGSAEQFLGSTTPRAAGQELQARRLRRFDNICALARALPSHLLHLSLTSAFWHTIEQTITREGESSS